jgi:phenylalanyl-tRNA synthetase alpha chain
MINKLNNIFNEVKDCLQSLNTLDDVKNLQTNFLGKKGQITEIFKSFGSLSPEERKTIGAEANIVKAKILDLFTSKIEQLENITPQIAFDITLPKNPGGNLNYSDVRKRATTHPILRMMQQLNHAFHSLGFEVFEGPEITSELYAFDNLNFPAEHPARESMDTYWIKGYEKMQGSERICLRPHLTGASVRYMQTHKPPFRFVYPGRVFRNESTDASHERAFFQYEALIVDQNISFSSVRLMVNAILELVFEREVKTRMRSGFFPFVEPGFEIDMQCIVCNGNGCSVCGQTGWIEVMPGGPPHPNVLKAGGIDPSLWQGAYINIGLDRMVMMKHAIDDVRLFHSGDLRFLQQFI